jgi:hypothetical protein
MTVGPWQPSREIVVDLLCAKCLAPANCFEPPITQSEIEIGLQMRG